MSVHTGSDQPPWSKPSVLASAFVLVLPALPYLLHIAGLGLTFSQFARAELGIVAAMLSVVLIQTKGWRRLFAGLPLLLLGLAPLAVGFFLIGEWRYMVSGSIGVVWLSVAFLLLFIAADRWYFKRRGPAGRGYTLAMSFIAFALYGLLFPCLQKEPLRAHILHEDSEGGEILGVNPAGTFVLVHSAVAPVEAVLYSHGEGALTPIHREKFPGYPVGLRVRDDHALIALRMEAPYKKIERIDVIRFSTAGIELVGSLPCGPAENPSHLVNNLSPDGTFIALRGGVLVEVHTGARREIPRGEDGPDHRMEFVRWTEPEGEAVYHQKSRGRLVVFNPVDERVDLLSLGNGGATPVPRDKGARFQCQLLVRPGARPLWYESIGDVSGPRNRMLPEGLQSPPAIFSETELPNGGGEGSSALAGQRITRITSARSLVTLRFDGQGRMARERHSQWLDVVTEVAFARDSGWLFWVTQAPSGEGTAIHGKQLR